MWDRRFGVRPVKREMQWKASHRVGSMKSLSLRERWMEHHAHQHREVPEMTDNTKE